MMAGACFDGLGRAASCDDDMLARQQPRVQFSRRRHRQLLPQRQALWRIESRALQLDCAQRRDAPQRLLGDRTTVGGVQVEELAPDMVQASQINAAVGEQGFVVHVIVHQQMAAPAMQEGASVGTGAACLIVEHDDERGVVVRTGAVGPGTSHTGTC